MLHVDLVNNPDSVELICKAIEAAKKETKKPSIIICKTKIGYGTPLEGSHKCHGAPLGAENLQKTKEKLGWPCAEAFEVPANILKHTAEAGARGAKAQKEWEAMFAKYEKKYPELAKAYKAAMKGELPDLAKVEDLFRFDKPMATRQTSATVLNKIAALVPNLIGGSADLAPSNLSDMKNTDTITYGDFTPENYAGRNMHFGIREHAMAAIANGMQLHGGLQCYCSTFFIFSD